VCRIPNLAIHLNREVNSQGLLLNAQTQLLPVLGLEAGSAGFSELLSECLRGSASSGARRRKKCSRSICACTTCSAPRSRAATTNFLLSSRLDNLASCHAALAALLRAPSGLDATRIVVLHDHEEVGSQSASGARSLFLCDLLQRIASLLSPNDSSAADPPPFRVRSWFQPTWPRRCTRTIWTSTTSSTGHCSAQAR